MLRKLFACLSLCFLFLFAGCATLGRRGISAEDEALLYPPASYVPESFEWEEICPGVSRFDFENAEMPLIYHAVKIDLSFVGAGLPGPESETESDQPLQLVFGQGESTTQFAAGGRWRGQCAVAANATPFTRSGHLVGVHKEAGELLSQPVDRYGAIGFRKVENRKGGLEARIFASQADGEMKDWPYALGGFFTVLNGGKVREDFIRRGDSRTGVGLSADGRTLYILLVEGERQRQSRGLSYPQCGQIFKSMGCSDALELDGGSSSELCIMGKSVLSYKVRSRQANSFGLWTAR